MWGSVGYGCRPEETSELAGDSDDGDVAGLAASAEALVETVETVLRTPGDLEDVVGLAGLAVVQRDADAAEAAQASDHGPVPRFGRQQREPLVERVTAGEQPVDRRERVEVGELGRDVLEALCGKPCAMRLRPGAAVINASVAKQ